MHHDDDAAPIYAPDERTPDEIRDIATGRLTVLVLAAYVGALAGACYAAAATR